MPSRYLYVHQSGSKDLSRWLHVSAKPCGELILHLTDLCQPGRISGLDHVTCPPELFSSIAAGSALQISGLNGYLLARPENDLLHIEFRSRDDVNPTKATVSLPELMNRLADLTAQPVPA